MFSRRNGATHNERKGIVMDRIKTLENFLLDKTHSQYGLWRGKLTAKEQRDLFGKYMGRGKFWIDGSDQTLVMTTRVAYGHDSQETVILRWTDL